MTDRPDKEVCASFYGDGKRCDYCPLYQPCVVRAPVGVLSREMLDNYTAAKIAAARAYLEEGGR